MGATIFAGYNREGYGDLVVIQHRLGYTSWYAHLSRVTSWLGERVSGGTRIGYVGATGHATGPHLHFEVRYRNVPVDPGPCCSAPRPPPPASISRWLPRAGRLSHGSHRRLPTRPLIGRRHCALAAACGAAGLDARAGPVAAMMRTQRLAQTKH